MPKAPKPDAPADAGWQPRGKPRRRGRFVLLLLAVGFVALAAGLLRPPDFHARREAALTPDETKELSRECVRRGVKVLDAVLNGAGRWEEEFRVQALNAWLAVDFPNQFGKALPRGAEPPVVDFTGDKARIGFRWGWGPFCTVVHAGFRVWVPKNNVLALELHESAAGSVPLPNAVVRQLVERAARAAGGEVSWKRHQGRLVALVRITARGFALQRVEVKDDAVRIGGRAAGIAAAVQAADAAVRAAHGDAVRR